MNQKTLSLLLVPLVLVFFGAAGFAGWIAYQGLASNVHDTTATPRAVAARGNLAEDEVSTIALFKQASPSVVHIRTSAVRYVRDWTSLRPLEVPQGTGSGFVWDERGYIVTNFHVILSDRQAIVDSAIVTLEDESRFEAKLVGYEPSFDIAVLKIDAPEAKLSPLAIGESANLQVGQKVFAIGNPFGLDHTLSTGVISGLNREIAAPNQAPISNVIQTDAAINPGNSGGPLLDSAGRLIGMNTAIVSATQSSAGIGFAVPVDSINRVVPRLIRGGGTDRPLLGFVAAQGAIAEAMRGRGVVVAQVDPSSGAAKAGIQPLRMDERGRVVSADVITKVSGRAVRSLEDVWTVLSEHKAGDKVDVELLRDGKPVQVQVELTARR